VWIVQSQPLAWVPCWGGEGRCGLLVGRPVGLTDRLTTTSINMTHTHTHPHRVGHEEDRGQQHARLHRRPPGAFHIHIPHSTIDDQVKRSNYASGVGWSMEGQFAKISRSAVVGCDGWHRIPSVSNATSFRAHVGSACRPIFLLTQTVHPHTHTRIYVRPFTHNASAGEQAADQAGGEGAVRHPAAEGQHPHPVRTPCCAFTAIDSALKQRILNRGRSCLLVDDVHIFLPLSHQSHLHACNPHPLLPTPITKPHTQPQQTPPDPSHPHATPPPSQPQPQPQKTTGPTA
jgi:hypothetical protein